MNRRLFLAGLAAVVAGGSSTLYAQPAPEAVPPKPPVDPAQLPQAGDGLDKALIDDTDVRPDVVGEDEASPSDARPPVANEGSPSDQAAEVPPAELAPANLPPAHAPIAPGGCVPCQPVACPPPPVCHPVCYPRRRRHHRRRRGC